GIRPPAVPTGLPTGKEFNRTSRFATLSKGIPNFEVREALNLNIIAEFTEQGNTSADVSYRKIKDLLKNGDLQGMLGVLKSLFASIPYQLHVDVEAYYHSIFYAVMSILGFDMDAEVSTSKGRIDAVLELDDKVYVMEFKYMGCAPDATPDEKRKLFDKALEEGLQQIKDRGYADKYIGSGKEIYQAAFAFLGRDDIEMRSL
ncbi:MAG: PD-(D/E)XK nuclease domain-containing protein, partial [Oscillospiraceae bacterium]|nr:PD-(D/E)XK nuclease domain-containing protein [Oscillospiraceae bacterium]